MVALIGMIEEPMLPQDDPDLPPEVAEIIEQLKLLYTIGGKETVRLALVDAGLPDEMIEEMMTNLILSMGGE